MEELRQDVQYAIRSLLRRPGFSLTAIAMLALGIGINTGMFSVIRAVLLEPLPYRDAGTLVRVYHEHHEHPEGGAADGLFSPPDYEDFAAAAATASLAAFWHMPGMTHVTVTGAGDAALLESAYVSPEFFATLGVAPALGRLPLAEEMQAGADRVVVLSHAEWATRFGGDATVIGSTVTLGNAQYTVLGVMPSSFAYPAAGVRVWLPLSRVTEEFIPRNRGLRYLSLVARLAPGTEAEAAAAELTTLAAQLAAAYPESNAGWRSVRLQPLRDEVLGSVRSPLLVLGAAVALVLLIACANLVNLLLARASSREAEFAIRSALGAGRGRIVRQIVTESTVLTLAGGVIGIVAAVWLAALVPAMAGSELPRLAEVRVDAVVIIFALALSLLAGLGTGIMPALRAASSTGATLREDGRSGTEGARRQRLRGALIASEMALAVVLVIAAGLMLRGLATLLQVDPGFDADRVLAVSLMVPSHRAGSLPESVVYRNELIERLGALPGVRSVAVAKTLPLEGGGEPFEFGMPAQGDATFRPEAGVMIVSQEYFSTLGIPVVRGRVFDERESRDADGINPGRQLGRMVINEAAARRYFPGTDAVGQYVTIGEFPLEIIGVVGDVRHDGLHSTPPATAYVPLDFMPRLNLRLMLRTEGDPAALVGPVRAAIRELDAGQPVAAIMPLQTTVALAAARERFLAILLTTFGVLALSLAALGIYGVVSYNVSQRKHEMGIRIALGARTSSVISLIVLQSARWWATGLVAGLVLAAGAVRLLQSLVYGVSVTDPGTFAAVALLLGGAALLASVVPAWRASRVDPTGTFR